MKKNEKDVQILKKLIGEQNAKGASLPEDLDSWRYIWDEEGPASGASDKESSPLESHLTARLTELHLSTCGLTGRLSVEALDALKELRCHCNRITQLDLSGCPALERLDCFDNKLKELDVSACPGLEYLDCGSNELKSLDVTGNPALESLFCDGNRIESLDVSSCPSLTDLEYEKGETEINRREGEYDHEK